MSIGETRFKRLASQATSILNRNRLPAIRVKQEPDRDLSQAAKLSVRAAGTIGGIAQLVEHELCKLGVTGSNPVASTMRREASGRQINGACSDAARDVKNARSRRACSSVG